MNRFIPKVVPLLLIGSAPACLSAQTRRDFDEVMRAADAVPVPRMSNAKPPSSGAQNGALADLAREVRLDAVLELALARNPDIGEAKERTKANAERALAVSRLPDLEFKYEQWGVPLSRPYALGEADTLMFGLRQSFPAPGTLGAEARAELEGARASLAAEATRAEEVRVRARRAFYEYFRTEKEYKIHLEHVELSSAIVDVARSNYQAGRGSQADLLRTIVELSRLHTDIASIDQARKSSRALLNALMARAPDAPLGPPEDVKPIDLQVRLDDAERLLELHRPELAAAEHAVQKRQAEIEAAESAGRWPTVMVGADYWYMPTLPSPHAYGAMVAVSLPWLSPRHGEEVRSAEHARAAEVKALESVRNTLRFELRDAAARFEAARTSYAILSRDLLPQARQSFEAARAGYTTGKSDAIGLLDAMRSYLQVRLEEVRALSQMGQSAADLERAIGTELPREAMGNGHE